MQMLSIIIEANDLSLCPFITLCGNNKNRVVIKECSASFTHVDNIPVEPVFSYTSSLAVTCLS